MAEPVAPGLDEFGAIARHLAPLAGPEGLGLLDDAALYTPPPGCTLVLTMDSLVAGVHFLPADTPAVVARKLARVNLSDLAAMGAEPLGYLLSAALPKATAEQWMAGLASGLAQSQALYGWRLWGGDTVTTGGPVTLTLTAIGSVPEGQALRRSGARAGDRIFVSGTIGDAALGLLVCQGQIGHLAEDQAELLRQRYYLPSPRLTVGVALRGLATAAEDVSDGLVADLAHIAETSGLGARLVVERIPLSAVAQEAIAQNPELFDRIFAGDDYELLFTVPPERAEEMAGLSRSLGIPLTEIGEMVAPETVDGERVRLFHEDGSPAVQKTAGFKHF